MTDADKTQDLPRDNAARLAIYDVINERTEANSATAISPDELFQHVIGRLRILVPRELHLVGDRAYVDEKIAACVEDGTVARSSSEAGKMLSLTSQSPLVRYPDGAIRQYTAGLELARERIDRDNSRLRAAGFDIRKSVPSISDDPKGLDFQALLGSMREHGYMKQFPIVRFQDGSIVDGRSRMRAAVILQLEVEYFKYGSERERTIAHRRDTPLGRALVAIHSNLGRLSSDVVDTAFKHVADVTGRGWDETAADLALTDEWRRSVPLEYSPWFEVRKLPYRVGEDPKIQVTSDRKVMLRSLVEAAGLSNYKIDVLREHVPFERARSAFSAGRKAVFARADDLIAGISTMQRERTAAKLKVDAEWGQILQWLVTTYAAEEA